MDDNVTITIEGKELSIKRTTTLHKAGQIISFLGFEQDSSYPVNNTPGAPQQLIAAQRLQPREVIINSRAKTYPQKIAALAMHLRDQLGQESFTPQEIKVVFKKMGDEPRNFSRDLRSALELQYIICTDAVADQYELTDKGAQAVENNFSGAAAKKVVGSKRATVSKGVRDEIKAMEVIATMDGDPNYHDLPTKTDKILWLMAYADKNGVPEITPSEIEFLSSRLRDKVASSGFTALNQRNMKKGYVAKNSSGFQIQKAGFDHLRSLQPQEEKVAA